MSSITANGGRKDFKVLDLILEKFKDSDVDISRKKLSKIAMLESLLELEKAEAKVYEVKEKVRELVDSIAIEPNQASGPFPHPLSLSPSPAPARVPVYAATHKSLRIQDEMSARMESNALFERKNGLSVGNMQFIALSESLVGVETMKLSCISLLMAQFNDPLDLFRNAQ